MNKSVIITTFQKENPTLAGRNFSKQREAIYEFLAGREDHPTADAVYSALKQEMSSLSLGTVYRNLKVLCEEGRIRKVDCGDGLDHFDAKTGVHQHFVCEKCGRIVDIFLGELPELKESAQAAYGGKVETAEIVFKGLCLQCTEKGSL